MKGHRIQRVEREIQEVLGQYIQRYMTSELPSLVSVSRVMCGKDLRSAKVLLSIMGEDHLRDECMEIIHERQSEIQRYLGKELSTRYTPKLQLIVDTGFDHMLKVDGLLKEIGEDQE